MQKEPMSDFHPIYTVNSESTKTTHERIRGSQFETEHNFGVMFNTQTQIFWYRAWFLGASQEC